MLSLKQQLIKMISTIEDEQLLQLLKADIEYFTDTGTDILDELNDADKEDLMNLVNEPDEKDTLTENEYKAATAKWRMK